MRDGPTIANALRAFAFLTHRCFGARCFFVQPHGVYGGGIIFDPLNGGFQILHDLVPAHHHHHVSGTKGNACHTVSDHIQVNQLSGTGHGIGSGDKQIHQKRLSSPFQALFRGERFIKGIQDLCIRIGFEHVIELSCHKRHGAPPGNTFGSQFWENFVHHHTTGFTGILGDEHLEIVRFQHLFQIFKTKLPVTQDRFFHCFSPYLRAV